MVKEKINPQHIDSERLTDLCQLILFNDNVNTFDFVIDTLVEVCHHDQEQAEQCAWIAHFKGKCPVKSGGYTELKPYYTELLRRGLTVKIE